MSEKTTLTICRQDYQDIMRLLTEVNLKYYDGRIGRVLDILEGMDEVKTQKKQTAPYG